MPENIKYKILTTVDTYIKESKIGDIEFSRRLLDNEISVLCWIEDLPCTSYFPFYRVEHEDSEIFVYSNNITSGLFTGLFSIQKCQILSILKHGSSEIFGKLWLTNHLQQKHLHGAQYVLPNENKELITLKSLKNAILDGNPGNEMIIVLESIFGAPLSDLIFKDKRGEGVDAVRDVQIQDIALNMLERILRNRFTVESWEVISAYIATSYDRITSLKEYLNNQLGAGQWATATSRLGVCDLDELLDKKHTDTELVKIAPPYVASRSDLVVVEDLRSYFIYEKNAPSESIHPLDSIDSETEQSDNGNFYMKCVEEVGHKFWGDYDPKEPATIPNAKKIIAWLIDERNLRSAKQAEHIEAVARDGRKSPPGRPKK
jgi:hypothetical protein